MPPDSDCQGQAGSKAELKAGCRGSVDDSSWGSLARLGVLESPPLSHWQCEPASGMSIQTAFYSSCCAQCKVVKPCHFVLSEIRLTVSGTNLIAISRCFLSFRIVITSQTLIVFMIKCSRPKSVHLSCAHILLSCEQCTSWLGRAATSLLFPSLLPCILVKQWVNCDNKCIM